MDIHKKNILLFLYILFLVKGDSSTSPHKKENSSALVLFQMYECMCVCVVEKSCGNEIG